MPDYELTEKRLSEDPRKIVGLFSIDPLRKAQSPRIAFRVRGPYGAEEDEIFVVMELSFPMQKDPVGGGRTIDSAMDDAYRLACRYIKKHGLDVVDKTNRGGLEQSAE
jgi:hypothetical protein